MNWQPINTAPKDGTPILTDDGICKHRLGKNRYNPKGIDQWCACGYDGDTYSCVEEGPWECDPKFWTPLPTPPKA